MVIRSSAPRNIPGNPLAGVLRQTARNARSTTRRTVSVAGPQGEAGVAGTPGTGAVAVAVLTTDEYGAVQWTFPAVAGQPVIVATAATVSPVVVAMPRVTGSTADFLTYLLDGSLVGGVTLHVAAFGELAPPPVDLPQQPDPEGT